MGRLKTYPIRQPPSSEVEAEATEVEAAPDEPSGVFAKTLPVLYGMPRRLGPVGKCGSNHQSYIGKCRRLYVYLVV